MFFSFFCAIFRLVRLLSRIRITGKSVIAPIPEPIMLRATRKPKYCHGTISDSSKIRNPADTDKTLITIAFPLIRIVSSRA